MKRSIFFSVFSILLLGLHAAAQDTSDDVVRITSQLVQLDAVVTDKDGSQVTGLTADDFQIFQDGKPQKITNLSYVEAGGRAPAAPPIKDRKNVILLPSPRGSGTIGRVITFVVDDGNCRASLVGMNAAREALEKFILEQMQPDDRVAIYKTRSGSSLFQQYTSDRARLLRAAKKISWYPTANGCSSSDGSFFDAARVNSISVATANGAKNVNTETADERRRREANEDAIANNQVVGTIGVLRYAITGLGRIPGRKVLFFLSDGMPFRARDGQALSAVDVLRSVADQANRSSVVINSIDVRGNINSSMIEARDEVGTLDDPAATDKLINERRTNIFNSQDGLAFIARETGGDFVYGQNYLHTPIQRALAREKGFYLLAYEPDDDTFKGKNFNRIEIRITRPGLTVTSRSGFLGVTDQEAKPKARTGSSELYDAIVAPLPAAGMNVRLTAFFANSPAGNFVRSLVHIPGGELTLVDDGKGGKRAVFDIVAVTTNEKNEVVDEFTREHSFKVEAAAVPHVERHGIVYSTDVPVRKPGTYNFRVALRDANSKLLGSASEMVDIPDLKKGRLLVSGLSVSRADANGKFLVPEAAKLENAISIAASEAVPAVRRIARGSIIAFPYTIYNAKLGADGKPDLSVKVDLYHDGALVVEGKPAPADLQAQADWSRIADYGYMRLDPALRTGDYVLQVTVIDNLAGKRSASRWVDFEVVE